MNNNYYVYLLTTKDNSVFYTGVTNDLVRRVLEHKIHLNDGFTKKYNVTKLVYYELFFNIEEAIKREKQLKKYPRLWKGLSNEMIHNARINGDPGTRPG